jgi:secretion/DNA translocation related TadE-like protein
VRWRSDDRGAGSVLALAVVAALGLGMSVLLPFTLLLPIKPRVKGAADAAALAAADAAVGLVPGAPCELAATVADANGSSVLTCRVDGLVATVSTGTTVLGVPISATSSAGPPAS